MKKNTGFLLLTISLFMTTTFLFAGGEKETGPAGGQPEAENRRLNNFKLHNLYLNLPIQ